MKWATHIRIANGVMDKLGIYLSRDEYLALKEGAIAPDKARGPPHQNPHHYGKSDVVGNYIKSARYSFLQGDLPKAYYDLGIVLHYIQDSYTTYPSFLPKHQEWEEWIENSYYTSNIEDKISNTVRNPSQRRWCSTLVQLLSFEVQGRDDTIRIATLNERKKDAHSIASPTVDYNLGFRASYVVAKSILGPKSYPPLDLELSNIFIRYKNQMIRAEDESSTRLIMLAEERDRLIGKITLPEGFMARLKNWIARIKIDRADKKAITGKNIYFQRLHLRNIVTRYEQEIRTITASHVGWYTFQVPPLDPNVVSMGLVDIQAASQTFKMSVEEIKATLNDIGGSVYCIDGSELIKRTVLDRRVRQEARQAA